MREADYLTEGEARDLVERFMAQPGKISSTQEILDSGKVARLKGYKVQPGKVSDSIYGGKGSYKGKDGKRVRIDNTPLLDKDGNPMRLMVRTERISTHDLNRGEIPFKDQILAANHNHMRRLVAHAVGTSQYEVEGLPDSSVVIAAENLKSLPIENVLRAFVAKSSTETSIYQHHVVRGKKEFSGIQLPEGLATNGPLPYVMDTPSTKSEDHDETLSPEAFFRRGLVTRQQYRQIRNAALHAFGVVDQYLRNIGMMLVDTKLEHGINSKGEIVSQDELFTMDSSRFWKVTEYQEQLNKFLRGEIDVISPPSFSKEFARGMSKGDQGYTEEQRVQIGVRYIMGIQNLLGRRFEPDMRPRDERVVSGLQKVVDELAA